MYGTFLPNLPCFLKLQNHTSAGIHSLALNLISETVDTMRLGKFFLPPCPTARSFVPEFLEKDPERFRRVIRGSCRLVRQGCKAKDGPTCLEVSAA
jgi:hypothetical protein